MEPETPRGATVQHRFQRQLCLAIDASSYGRLDSVAQYETQAVLAGVLDEAATEAGLDRSRWLTQAQGDGELSLIPSDQPEPRVVDDFIRELDAVLRLRNQGREPGSWLRLRVALDFGEAYEAPMGFAGEAVVATARLLASVRLHQALAAGAYLAVAVSPLVYRTVANRHTSIDPALFTRAEIAEKEYRSEAWIRVFRSAQADSRAAAGCRAAAPAPAEAAPSSPAATPPYGLQNNFYAEVEADVIGMKFVSGPEAGHG